MILTYSTSPPSLNPHLAQCHVTLTASIPASQSEEESPWSEEADWAPKPVSTSAKNQITVNLDGKMGSSDSDEPTPEPEPVRETPRETLQEHRVGHAVQFRQRRMGIAKAGTLHSRYFDLHMQSPL